MAETDGAPEFPLAEFIGAKKQMHPNSLANLRPPWAPGESGNRWGTAADGTGSKDHAIKAHLRAKLEQRSGKRTWAQRVVDGWVEAAARGDAAARRDILERLYPVEKEGGEGRQILTGIKLELSEGKTTATLIAALDAQNAVPLLGSSSTQGRIEAECPADSAATTPTGLAPGADQLPAGQDSATAERAATSPTSAPNGPGASSD